MHLVFAHKYNTNSAEDSSDMNRILLLDHDVGDLCRLGFRTQKFSELRNLFNIKYEDFSNI